MTKECDNPESGCDLECMECEIPTMEPEGCSECQENLEADGIEYEFNVTHQTGRWTCESCGRGV